MLIVMDPNATADQIDAVVARINALGFSGRALPGAQRTAVAVTGNQGAVDQDAFIRMAGVKEVVRVSAPYKLVSREVKPDDTVIDVRGVKVGGTNFVVMAGPCSVETREQLMETADAVKAAGATILRGGAYKPRTSPYEFQGMGEAGLKLLAEARERTGMPIVTEVMDTETVDVVCEHADILQIGARNMQNFALLQAIGKTQKPILLKRGMAATLKELLMAAEYIIAAGNPNVMLCERGVRTFETMTRNTFDVSAIHMLRRLTHLPIVADPSHAIGIWHGVPALARAAVVADAQALIIEVHPRPEEALSDGPQALKPETFQRLMDQVRKLRAVMVEDGQLL